jgi:hypothetical protein
MERFHFYFRSNLRITRETRLKAAVLLVVLFIFLMLAYWAGSRSYPPKKTPLSLKIVALSKPPPISTVCSPSIADGKIRTINTVDVCHELP